MAAGLWYGIIQYFVGIIIVLALLFALMESSRKYDRYREWPYLAVASGYFLLVVWSLLRALSLNSGVLHGITIGSELIGFLVLGIGYLALEHAHPYVEEEPEPGETSKPDVIQPSSDKKNKEGWVSLLSAENVENTIPDKIESTKVEASLPSEPEKVDEVPSKEKQPSVKQSSDEPAVDLSYLAQKVKKKSAQPITHDSSPAITPTEETNTTEASPATPVSDAEKTAPIKGIKDSDVIEDKEKKQTKKPVEQPAEEESREELLDDLFPIKAHPESEPLVASKEPVVKPKKTVKKVDKTKTTKQILPAGILISGLNTQNLLTVWPQATIALVLIFIILELIPQREVKGNKLLIVGFITLFLATLTHVLFDANAATLPNLDEQTGIFQLAALILEVVGFSCIGASSWQKIKGKVTHHFLVIISVLFGLLLILTVGLANLIVSDESGLQLLTLLMTGVLITLLPIVHALAYNHPHHNDEIHHD